jgi:hypothetical protein
MADPINHSEMLKSVGRVTKSVGRLTKNDQDYVIGDDIIIRRQDRQNYATITMVDGSKLTIQLYYNQSDILSLLTGVKKWDSSVANDILRFSDIHYDSYLLSNCQEIIDRSDVIAKTQLKTPYCYDRDRNVISYVGTGKCNFAKINQCNQVLTEIKKKSIISLNQGHSIWESRQCTSKLCVNEGDSCSNEDFLENDFDQIGKVMTQHQNYISQLSEKHLEVLEYYTENGSEDMNSYLATAPKLRQINPRLQSDINYLRQMIESSPPLSYPLVVYRGIRTKAYNQVYRAQLENASVGDEIQLPDGGFISTSLSSNVALKFTHATCCFIIIYLPKGTHGLYLGNQSEYSEEYEFLLSDKQRFRYFKCGKTPMTISFNTNSYQIQVHHVVAI